MIFLFYKMKKVGKSIFDFWKIPNRKVDFFRKHKIIYINKHRLIKSNKILKLEIDKKIRPKWLVGEGINIYFPKVYKNEVKGEVLAYFFDKEKLPAIVKKDEKIIFNFDPEETINSLLAEKYVKKKRPIYTFLPFHYHKIPFRIGLGKLQTFIRSRFSKQPGFPGWPIEGSVDVIRTIFLNSLKLIQKNIKIGEFWPNGKKFAIALTHDIDTGKGLKNIKLFSAIEEQFGFRSTWFIVGDYYKKDYEQLNRLIDKRHEIGLHGYSHDNKLAYLSIKKIEERISKCRKFIGRYGIKGFRSPSLLNSENLEKVLQKYFLYDSTIPTNEKYLSDSDYSGCCSAFPYFKGRMLEIPITMPMDSSLVFLNYSTDSISDLWIKKLDWIKALGGVAILNVHPEPHFSGNKKMLNVYRKFIGYISTMNDVWVTTMEQIANHWKKRAEN